jgi:hypothetical protein
MRLLGPRSIRGDTGWRKAVLSREISTCFMDIAEPRSHKRKRVTPMSIHYKFFAIHQKGFLSSSPRWLSIRFFSKAGHWLVSTERCPFVWHGHDIDSALQPRHFRVLVASTPTHSNLFYHTNIFEHALLHVPHHPCSRGVCCRPVRPN